MTNTEVKTGKPPQSRVVYESDGSSGELEDNFLSRGGGSLWAHLNPGERPTMLSMSPTARVKSMAGQVGGFRTPTARPGV